MNQAVERKGFKIESISSQKKKTKEKKSKSKVIEHVQIIDDDALIPWDSTTPTPAPTISKTKRNQIDPTDNDEIISVEDAPVIVGKVIISNNSSIINSLSYV
jgi:hypothetical protein